jgi:hypothetical protein
VDIEWQQAQGLFQTGVTFALAASILTGFMRSKMTEIRDQGQRVRSKLLDLANNILIIKFAVELDEWNGPNLFPKLWDEYTKSRDTFSDIEQEIYRYTQRCESERRYYVISAIANSVYCASLLLYSTLHPTQHLPLAWVWSFAATAFALPLFALSRIPWWHYRLSKFSRTTILFDFELDPYLDRLPSETGKREDRPNTQIHGYKVRRGLYHLDLKR